MAIGLIEQSPFKTDQGPINGINLLTQPEAQIGTHLIIATPPGVELLSKGAEQLDQPSFNGEVNILSLQTRLKQTLSRLETHPFQAFDQGGSLVGPDHTTLTKHAGMGHRSIQILLEQGDVKTDRGIEAFDRRMETLLKAIAPAAGSTAGDPGFAWGGKRRINCHPGALGL
jgi:hypothetical protein